ncbi:MAG: hypothetical protein JNG85_15620 [Spirochaetaceae bacterium]|nr:hypothetical protein [Spirochaetaceae bacterium]
MGTVSIIVGGIIVLTLIAAVGDVASKAIGARSKARDLQPSAEIEELRARLRALESRLDERDGAVRRLEEELRFVTRMLEDKSGGKS